MSKFKVGDEVAIAAVVKITAVQQTGTGKVSYATDRGFCIHEVLMDEIALSAKPTDRLMGREEQKPQPTPKFKVGDRVVCDEFGEGIVELVNYEFLPQTAYIICLKNERRAIVDECDISHAPEPKYYTGRVRCICVSECPICETHRYEPLEIKDGIPEDNLFLNGSPFASVDAFKKQYDHLGSSWIEVKE